MPEIWWSAGRPPLAKAASAQTQSPGRVEAFTLLDQIVEHRTAVMTLVDTWVGFRTARGRPARRAALPTVLVIMNTAVALCPSVTGSATGWFRRLS
jgi:hypothetical protein